MDSITRAPESGIKSRKYMWKRWKKVEYIHPNPSSFDLLSCHTLWCMCHPRKHAEGNGCLGSIKYTQANETKIQVSGLFCAPCPRVCPRVQSKEVSLDKLVELQKPRCFRRPAQHVRHCGLRLTCLADHVCLKSFVFPTLIKRLCCDLSIWLCFSLGSYQPDHSTHCYMALLLVRGLRLDHSSSAKHWKDKARICQGIKGCWSGCSGCSWMFWVSKGIKVATAYIQSSWAQYQKLSHDALLIPEFFIHQRRWESFFKSTKKHPFRTKLSSLRMWPPNPGSVHPLPSALEELQSCPPGADEAEPSADLIPFHHFIMFLISWQLISKCCTPVQPPRTRISAELEILTASRLSRAFYS